MTKTKAASSEAAISETIEQKRQRKHELETRAAAGKGELERLRTEYSRALADGDDAPATEIPGRLRELTEEQEALTRAIEHIDAALLSLESEMQAAVAAEKATIAVKLEQEASALGQQLHSLIESFGTAEILPLAERFQAALKVARAAERDHDHAAAVTREPWDRGVDRRVYEPRARALRVVDVIQRYIDGRSLPVATSQPTPVTTHAAAALQ